MNSNAIKKQEMLSQDDVHSNVADLSTRRKSSREDREIDELRKANTTLNSLISHAPMSLISINKDRIVTMWNPTAEKMFGLKSSETIGKKNPLCPKRDKSEFDAMLKRAFSGESIVGFSVEHERHDGSKIDISISTTPLYDAKESHVNEIMLIATDITEFVQAEQEIKNAIDKLRRTFDGTVFALASLVEKRDPYTAGHQERVARIATTIAENMDLSHEQVEGVRVASLIHDIGKVSIPAEILTKPGRLTDIEFSLIKHHSLNGYEILASIDFPWPVAQTVLQHHERMNGAGYPLGLTRDQILTEAKIISIADVVEAMASDRPYRASLGVEAALNEIEKNKGELYDPDAANMCLKLFKEQGFKLY